MALLKRIRVHVTVTKSLFLRAVEHRWPWLTAGWFLGQAAAWAWVWAG